MAKLNTKIKTDVQINGFVYNGILRTAPCSLGLTWGKEICSEIKLNNIIEEADVPDGKYKISIVLEKID